MGIITCEDNLGKAKALLIVNQQRIGIDGNFIFGDEDWGIRIDR